MAIVQVSRITNRKGLTENLPQLAGAELGWCVDSRRLFIGNGTLQEGAPVIGNTEILTEFSDVISQSPYTYKDIAVGYAAQTGPSPSEPVVRTVQEKLDDFADVRDFGAVGDGVADDTGAINRALYQLYCVAANPQIRRSLFFPAGIYRVTSTIIIPTYAKLVGEGANCSTILFQLAPTWNGTISYTSGSTVIYSGSYYQALVDVPAGIAITNTLYWNPILSTWTSTVTWAKGSIVIDSGTYYEAQQSVPIGQPITNVAYWAPTSFYAARFGDSLQQTGVNIGNNGATPPQNIEISSMSFRAQPVTDVFLVEDATQCYFDSVDFVGPFTNSSIVQYVDISPPLPNIAGVRFASTPVFVSTAITFDKCRFSGLAYGINTDEQINSVTVSNGRFDTLYQGIVLGAGTPVNGGPTGFRTIGNMFDNIFAEGIIYDDVSLNVSAYNIFYNVGTKLSGANNTPFFNIIVFGQDDNASISDLFERSDINALTSPRIKLNGGPSSSSSFLRLGRYSRATGKTLTLLDNRVTPANLLAISSADSLAANMNYTITRGTSVRSGVFMVVNQNGAGTLTYSDDYNENSPTGITLFASQIGSDVVIQYTSTSTGASGTLLASFSFLS